MIILIGAISLFLWRCYYVRHYKRKVVLADHSVTIPGILHNETRQVNCLRETTIELEKKSALQQDSSSELKARETSLKFPVQVAIGSPVNFRSRVDREGVDLEASTKFDAQVGGDVRTLEASARVSPVLVNSFINRGYESESDMTMDVYPTYDQVSFKKEGETNTDPHPPETSTVTSVEDLYAKVDKTKKKKRSETIAGGPSESATSVENLYAKVDKTKKKKRNGLNTEPRADTVTETSMLSLDRLRDHERKESGDSEPEVPADAGNTNIAPSEPDSVIPADQLSVHVEDEEIKT